MRVVHRCLRPDEFDTEALVALALAAYGAMAGALLLTRDYLWACPFLHFTGLPCPACGGTRSVSAMLAGDLPLALSWNPLMATGVLGAVLFMVYVAVVRLFGLPRVRVLSSADERCWFARGLLVMLLGNWVYLLIVGV